MIEPKTKMIEGSSGVSSEIFAIGNTIIPIRRVTPELIANLDDISDLEVVPGVEVKTIVLQNRNTNPISLFFNKVSTYLDSLQSFLTRLENLYQKIIEQKKLLYRSESEEQLQRTDRAKRTARRISDERKKSQSSKLNLEDSDDLNFLTSVVGASVVGAIGTSGAPLDIPFQPEPGQLIPKGKTTVGQISGYPVTSGFGWRWGRVHGGVDVGVDIGTMFAVKAESKVVYAGWQDPKNPDKGYGLLVDVWIDQIQKMIRFAHLSSVAVKVGDTLPPGTILGRSGDTGRSTGPHFHIEAHDTVTPMAGSKDPTPYLGYVILGDAIQKRSEGAVERVGRIMVGEAGAEFVVPISQMPTFTYLMLEEKIKSLNPYYVPQNIFGKYGIKEYLKSSGNSNSKYASGKITGGSPEFWKIVAISSREDSIHPQGQADVAQSIYNRVAIGSYPGGRNISKIITAPGQYEPTFANPGAWGSIKDRSTAIAAAGKGAPPIDMAAKSITNPILQKEAARFVGGRTDFMGESQKPYMKPGDITRGKNQNFFGWFYNARLPKAAAVHPSVQSMTKISTQQTDTKKPQQKKPEPNLIEKIMNWVKPPMKKVSELNTIDDSLQMEIAKDTQQQFSFDGAKNEIIAFYKPTVYYPEEVG